MTTSPRPTLSTLLPGLGQASLHSLRVPSPLEQHASLSATLGVDVWLKREDLIDDFGCGHKSRKLAYVGADALRTRANVLITAVSLPSSQAIGVAYLAQRLGMRAHIVYCGEHQEQPSELAGNYLIVSLLGPSITWRPRSLWSDWPSYVAAVAEREIGGGNTPYIVPPGVSRWPGLVGSIELGVELAGQLEDVSAPVHIVGAAGSGGTLLGVSIGLRAAGISARVHGVCIGAPLEIVQRELHTIRADAIANLPPELTTDAPVDLYEGARGEGYDMAGDAEFESMAKAARDHGLLLDPTYMTKAFIGLQQLVATATIPRQAHVVLLHSGGALGMAGGGRRLNAWLRHRTPHYFAATD